MNRILFPLLALFCLISLCGCSDNSQAPKNQDELEIEQEYKKYGLNFSKEEIAAAVEAAKQYYADVAASTADPNLFYEEELDDITQWKEWLSQGVDIVYEKEKMYSEITASSLKNQIDQKGAGNVIVLQVTVTAAPSDYPERQRIIELNRENAQAEWIVRTEGL